MDKFGHEPLHYPDEVQPDKHKHDRDQKGEKPKDRRRAAADEEEQDAPPR